MSHKTFKTVTLNINKTFIELGGWTHKCMYSVVMHLNIVN